MATDRGEGGSARPATEVRIPDHVVFRSFPTETVALNLETGRYHGLNPTAGRMLEVIETSADLAAAAQALAAEYGQPLETVEADLGRLCADLAERGLIELDPDDRA
jgi:Coenzyme PQQ synthesis protein D (PqqD)